VAKPPSRPLSRGARRGIGPAALLLLLGAAAGGPALAEGEPAPPAPASAAGPPAAGTGPGEGAPAGGAWETTPAPRREGAAEPPLVVKLELPGVNRFSPGELLEKLGTQVTELSPRFPIFGPIVFSLEHLASEPVTYRLDTDALDEDRRRIVAFYRERGYYQTKVAAAEVLPVREGAVKVVFRVEEGLPVLVRRVDLEWDEEAPEARAKLDKLPIKAHDVFTESAYDATRDRLKDVLRNTGWATAEVDQEAHVLPEDHAADVRYRIHPGPRFRFGPILVAGSAAVSRERIKEQAGLEIKPGGWFEDDALAKAQGRVYDMGVFGGVRVTRGTPDPQRGIIPVLVVVREAPFHTLRMGPGVGLEANTRVDVNGTISSTDRNFYGDLRRLQLELRGGYAWLLTTPPKQGPVMLASAEFTQPRAITSKIDFTVRLEVERSLEQGYDYWAERVRLSTPWRVTRRFTFIPSYNLEVYQLSHVIGGIDLTDPNGPQLQNCQGDICLLSYLEQRFVFDQRDDPINTRAGYWLSLAVQEGFHLGGFGYAYFRVLPETRGFLPLGDSTVLATRLRIGALVPAGEAGLPPIVARFKSGGAQSQRGFQTGRLSPMVYQDGEYIPVGGNGLVEGSLELRLTIAGSWGAVLFVDAGNVSEPSGVPSAWRQALDLSQLYWTVGAGLRYRTLFGPVRLDLGMQVPVDWAPGVAFSHRFKPLPVLNGGTVLPDGSTVPSEHREPWLGVQLSLGEAF